MKRGMLAGSALAALLCAPVFAQTAPSTPSTPTSPAAPATPSVPNPGLASPLSTEVQRVVPPTTEPTGAAARGTLSSADDLLADKIQGLTVYSTKAPARASTPAPASGPAPAPATGTLATSGSTTLAKDQYQKLRDSYQSVGTIDDIVVSPEGQVRNALVSVGGFLGVGNRNVAVSWNEVRFVRTNDGDVLALIDKSKAELEQMPEYKAANR